MHKQQLLRGAIGAAVLLLAVLAVTLGVNNAELRHETAELRQAQEALATENELQKVKIETLQAESRSLADVINQDQ